MKTSLTLALAAVAMMLEVHIAAVPGIQPLLEKPDDKVHAVLDPAMPTEVLVMNEVVLELVQDGKEEGEDGAAEVTRLHRQVRQMRAGRKRQEAESRVQSLLASGVRPVVPEFDDTGGSH
jgi:hypothetical protein